MIHRSLVQVLRNPCPNPFDLHGMHVSMLHDMHGAWWSKMCYVQEVLEFQLLA